MDPNVCKCHALGKYLFLQCLTVADRIYFVFSGLAAANYSHVGYFPGPCREEYDKYYATMLHVVNIAFLPFAERIQELLVEELTALSERTGSWFRDNWTGRRGRYVFAIAHMAVPTTTWALRSIGVMSRRFALHPQI